MPPKKRQSNGEPQPKGKRAKKNGSANGSGDTDSISSEFVQHVESEEPEIKLEGSLLSGELLLCGSTNWDLTGRKTLPVGVKSLGGRNLWSPFRVSSLKGVQMRSVVAGCCACHSVAISTEGKVYTWGRNEKAQLGHGDTKRRDIPTVVKSLTQLNIVDAACGRGHTLFLSDRGQVYACGDNKMGQLGLGTTTAVVASPIKVDYKGPPIRRLSCGSDFSMMVDVRGNLYSFGSPEYGQLGHNTDGKYFVSSSKMSFSTESRPVRVHLFIEKGRDNVKVPVTDVEITDVACGVNHALAIDRKKRAFSWGFGGYGRLGHSEPKDEFVPRLIKFFEGHNRGATAIQAGSAFSLAVNELGILYMWGQNKPSGEATMYPKPVQDLSGWNVRSFGCGNRSVVVAADQSLVTWGPSPTYGELGYGEDRPKSSTVPQEVKTIKGLYPHKVAAGFGHTLVIVRNESEEEQAKLDSMPTYTPEHSI